VCGEEEEIGLKMSKQESEKVKIIVGENLRKLGMANCVGGIDM
jgi:hypothetical protein